MQSKRICAQCFYAVFLSFKVSCLRVKNDLGKFDVKKINFVNVKKNLLFERETNSTLKTEF